MSDKELLEFAAKAAGIELVGPVKKFIVQFDERHKGGFIVRNDRGGDSAWNPLNDDGDALRLAVKLRLEFEWWKNGVAVLRDDLPPMPIEHVGADPYAATRRAIVRAAVEIGKAMP